MFHQHYLSECVGRHQTVLLVKVVQENRLEAQFKGDNIKAFKSSNCGNLFLYFSENVQNIAAFAMPFWFLVTKQSLENGFGFPQ